jgi:hypothetical protein
VVPCFMNHDFWCHAPEIMIFGTMLQKS